jgi:hypothetical protein
MLAQAVTDRVDPHAGNLVRVLLKLMADTDPWMPVSQPIHRTHIEEEVRQRYLNTNLNLHLDEYIRVLGMNKYY